MTADSRRSAQDLLDFAHIGASPWHAVAEAVRRLEMAGYRKLRETDAWSLRPGGRHYVVRDGSSIIAFRLPDDLATVGLRVVGAHTDSPGLRIKPRGAQARAGSLLGLAVEVYGGPILATFADRDLTLAGRLVLKGGAGTALVRFDRPLLRLPTPAIHLNRDVNEQGLRFEPQEELGLILGALDEQLPPDRVFLGLLAERADVEPDSIAAWELAVADTQPGAFFGLADEFIATSRLDNLASCHAALEALLNSDSGSDVAVCALFDHEEVGSQSYKGAEGSFLEDVLARLLEACGHGGADAGRRVLARSLLLSADMAHGFLPSFARYYDEQHAVWLNGGPVIKINVKQRYATDAVGEAYFAELCEQEGVSCQRYVHRNNLPCGSTIGPLTASRLGIRTVDVGNAMWSMHSIRETAGTHDHHAMIRVLTRFFGDSAALPAE